MTDAAVSVFPWRPMQAADLPDILALADVLHPDYPERIEIFADKLAFCPPGCAVIRDAAGTLAGYAFAHPWRVGVPPLLDAVLTPPPGPQDCLHLHDIAITPAQRGQGGPAAFLRIMTSLARDLDLPMLSLVAIKGQHDYWRRKGFADHAGGADLTERLASYGNGGRYMTRRRDPAR